MLFAMLYYLIGGEERTSPIRDEVLLISLSYGARMQLDRATLIEEQGRFADLPLRSASSNGSPW